MEADSKKKYIAKILDRNELLTKSDLSKLSSLTSSDLEFLKQFWAQIDTERRRQIISSLVMLGQSNFKLDFSSIFSFCFYDSDPEVRVNAIVGLEDEGDYQYISPLVHLLTEDSADRVREAAARALGKFALLGEIGKLSDSATNEVYHALLSVMDSKTASIEMKCLVLEAIAPLNLPRVKALIEEYYHNDDIKIKASALRAIGSNCNISWLADLLSELGNNNDEIRYEAVHAIGEIGSEEAIPALTKLLEDSDERVQEAAIKAMGEIGGQESRQSLNKLTRNSQQRIRQAARAALKELDFCEDPLSPNL